MLRSGSILDEAGEFHVSVERALADTCYGCNSMAKQYIKPNHNHGEQDDNALDDDGHSGSGSISIGVIISHAISRFFEAAAIPEWDERLGIGLTVWLDLVEWLCDQPEVRGHHQNILHNIELYPYVIFPKTYVRADAGMLFLGLLQLLVDKHGARLDVVPCYVWNGRRRKNRDRLTIGQILATAGDMMTDSLPWLVEEKGVNIQSLDSSTSFLRSSWGTETVTLFHRLLAEQKERFDLVDEVIENGLSSSLQDRVDVRRLTDRYGRPLLEAATREKRPREVLDSIAAAMEARVGNVPRS